MTDVTVTTDFLSDVVSHIEKTSEIEKAQANESQSVDAEAKQTLAILKKAGLCDVTATDEALLKKLADHPETLRVLGRLAENVPPPSIGTPDADEEKQASEAGSEDMKESDRRFLSRLGLL